MENKTKKTKVDYAAIIREYEMYGREWNNRIVTQNPL